MRGARSARRREQIAVSNAVNKAPIIICLGIAVRDLVFEVPSLPSTPRKLTARALHHNGGGMAATAAVAAAALGGNVSYWGRLGDDATGRELREELQTLGVRVVSKLVPGTQTPLAAVLVADNGDRLLAVFRGNSSTATDWLPIADLACADAVHADFRWPEGARVLYREARQKDIPRILDADVGEPETLRQLLPLVDHAIFSELGLAELSGTNDIDVGLRHAATLTHGVVAVTLGERGSVFRIDGFLHPVATPVIVARDTNGAGDVFHGAYAFALARGDSTLDAAGFASAVAALKCQKGGGWHAAPRIGEVNEFLKKSNP